mmetsp:Transcript_6861/g.7317  ORF Transcript_6861/g.7317 Transcript_6861/m.7317 type:complete len:515 (+) Transcript_6861:54-1598(+)
MFAKYNNNNKESIIATTAIAAASVVFIGYYIYKNNNNNNNNKQNDNNDTQKSNTMISTPPPSAAASSSGCPFSRGTSKSKASYPNAAKRTKEGIITNLQDVKRSSEGMGLPTSLEKEVIDIILATAPAVAPQILDITKRFYTNVLGAHPELLQFFNAAHNVPISDEQPKALAGSVIAYVTNITDLTPLLVPGGPVAAICHRHCALAIHPMQYVVVHDALMGAIGEILGAIVTPDIANAWSTIVLFLAKAMIDTEEALYHMAEQRNGGWSGFAEFTVTKIDDITSEVKRLTFQPTPDSPLAGTTAFDFTPGQYLSLQIDMDNDGRSAPRHYTCTSTPGTDYLSCTIKKHGRGKLSTYVHDVLEVGDTVTLSAPFGVFVEPEKEEEGNVDGVTSTVLMSAGIGVTPMINLYNSKTTDVKLVVHIDKTPDLHPYKQYFDDTGIPTLFKYTKNSTRPTPQELVHDTMELVGTQHHFYLCGPAQWMDDTSKELLAQGAQKVICEVFGSQLATGCPFFAG